MFKMMKSTVKVICDRDTDICYITRNEDEQTKNHKETDKDIVSGYVPEMPEANTALSNPT